MNNNSNHFKNRASAPKATWGGQKRAGETFKMFLNGITEEVRP